MKDKFSYKLTFYGMLGMFLTFVLMVACQKDTLTDLELIQEKEPTFTEVQYRNTISLDTIFYDSSDFLEFLSTYSSITPDIIPAFNNFYNDIAGGGSYVGNLTLVNEERFFDPTNELIMDTTGYVFDWYINDVLQCSEANPQFWDLDNNLDCDGVFELQLVVTTPNGAEFSRTQWFYANYNGVSIGLPTCVCPECPSQFNVFYTFWPDVEPYFFQTEYMKWDLNDDNRVDVNDLLLFLPHYGG
jgi:hypothetical protein